MKSDRREEAEAPSTSSPTSSGASTSGAAAGLEHHVLAGRLDRVLGSSATVLHDRRLRADGGRIDHLVIAPSGIWVVIVGHDQGLVVVGKDADRPMESEATADAVGNAHRTSSNAASSNAASSNAASSNAASSENGSPNGVFERAGLTVGGRDQSALMAAASERSVAVAASLDSVGVIGAPVHAVLCLAEAEWGFFVSPVRVGTVLVTWPSELVDDIRLTHRWDPAAMARASMHLRAAVPSNAQG